MIRNTVFCCAAVLSLGACAQTWQTAYDQTPDLDRSVSWRLSGVDVDVPRSLTVSEQNTFAPDADIVWREEPLGDRHAQVDRILTEAVKRGASGLNGKGRGVRVEVTLNHFHALTQKARQQLQSSGVHNIGFAIKVVDAHSGEVLAAEADVEADLLAFVGDQAIAAVAQGETQRVRIVRHVAAVVSGWLGTGPDVRRTFTRRGR